MDYRVSTFRAAGFAARWTKGRTGKPYIAVRVTSAGGAVVWMAVTDQVWRDVRSIGITAGIARHSALIDVFGLPA